MTEEEPSLQALVKELTSTVKTLQGEVSELRKEKDGAVDAPRRANKHTREDEDVITEAETLLARDGEVSKEDSRQSDTKGNTPKAYAVSAKGEAFLETTFGTKLEYTARRKHLAKIGSPETRWVKTPVLPPVMASILPKETVKEDKRTFRTQQLWLEAAAPLMSLQETAHEDRLDPKTAVTMVQSALLLMGDAPQHQSANRQEVILKQLNPQIANLMKEEDYSKILPLLFGEDFGAKVKARMEEAAALKKDTSTVLQREREGGFSWGLPSKEHKWPWGWPTKCLRPWTIQEVETSHREQAWKKMTRTAINHSCKQFNKICVCYPAVITNWYPSTPHKGANGDIRHVNTGPLPSREASPLCKKLGGNYPGPMGPAGNSRVQIRPDPNPSPENQTSCAAPQSNGPGSDNRGGARIAGQTGHQGGSTFSQQFYFPTLPGGKERGLAETSGQSEGSEHFCTLGALQDGRPPHSPRPDSNQGLYDQARSERCISSNSNPSGSPTSPSISVDGENIPILMPSFRADLSSKSVYQGSQARSQNTPADGDSVSNLPGQYPYPPSGQGGARVPSPSNLQSFRSTGFGDQHQEIFTNSPTDHRIPRIPDKFSDSANSDATGEAEENSARCQMVATTSVSHCARSSPFCGENDSFMQGNLASSPTLQGNPSLDELSVPRDRGQLSPNRPVQCQASAVRESATGPSLVGITRSNCSVTSPSSTKGPQYDYHVRCLHHRLGSLFGGHNYRGDMVSTGDDAPHQLFGAISRFPGSAMLSEDREQYDHSSEVGQCDSSHLHQPDGGNSLQAVVPLYLWEWCI